MKTSRGGSGRTALVAHRCGSLFLFEALAAAMAKEREGRPADGESRGEQERPRDSPRGNSPKKGKVDSSNGKGAQVLETTVVASPRGGRGKAGKGQASAASAGAASAESPRGGRGRGRRGGKGGRPLDDAKEAEASEVESFNFYSFFLSFFFCSKFQFEIFNLLREPVATFP